MFVSENKIVTYKAVMIFSFKKKEDSVTIRTKSVVGLWEEDKRGKTLDQIPLPNIQKDPSVPTYPKSSCTGPKKR
jgi:hypothetical protein